MDIFNSRPTISPSIPCTPFSEFKRFQATGGFAGPGYVELDDDMSIWQHIVLDETDGGELMVTGTFYRYDEDYYYDNDMGGPLPPSIALFVYLELDDGSFIRGVGVIDPSTGEFTATVTGIPDGLSTVFYSFVFLDPDDTLDSNNPYGNSVFDSEVISYQCPSPLTITLEWSSDNSDLDMEVTEPDGSSWYAWDVGVSSASFPCLLGLGWVYKWAISK